MTLRRFLVVVRYNGLVRRGRRRGCGEERMSVGSMTRINYTALHTPTSIYNQTAISRL